MRHLDLFSGIGGFALAARWAGIETVAFCEIEEFPRKVLNKNFPGIPIHHDIRELDGKDYEGIDLITGGYPCQPFSSAGKRKGQEDDRHLWPEMLRIITQARPAWVVCENVSGHITLGLDEVLTDLESEGYAARAFIIPACAKNADHRRDRVWIVANATGLRQQESNINLQMSKEYTIHSRFRHEIEWLDKSELIRAVDGVPDQLDRLKSLGNAIVPQVAYEILRCIRAL